ncbi:Phosphotransferase enzyme family protein [Planctomycetes bacterium Poly30]|uniref:Phosphotransferase enzyme family protein n=1 Tax=Saltatorellus ferox TaxID=2528018 RepID=A0A518EVS2_9BACT|nr:Phosphotransferase enzyme family protein [Planctomycetes bacterium Poly30]
MESNGEWGRALTLIQGELRSEDVEARVIRVEARKDGSQVWALDGEGGPLWFVYDNGRLQRANPWEDRKLPAAAECLRDGLLAWRPGRRAVATSRDGGAVTKLFRPKRLEDAVLRHELALAGAGRIPHWQIPGIQRVDREAARIDFERIQGTELPVLGRHAGEWRRIGAGLAEFQRALDVSGLPRHGRREELDGIAQLHRRYSVLFGDRLPDVDDAVHRLERWVAKAPPRVSVAVHRDFHDGQFLVTESGVTVLDFDQLCAGEPEVDLGNLTAHFVLRQLQNRSTVQANDVRDCALAAMTGFEIDEDESAHAALRFYQAATFVRLAVLYSLRPRWRSLRGVLLQHASASLDELCHA